MASTLIGSLRVTLGIDTAAFSAGLKSARKSLKDAAKQMKSVGGTISTYVSAPLAAAGGAIGLGVGKIAADLATLGNQAKVAGAGVGELQRFAAASKSVGVEQDKLTDILKDVNDKVGEFAQTGGGEMTDFFKNIAPKVGITAEAFKGLSGPQALQLYYSSLEKAGLSQAEMTFYMEAIADEATALAPLLANNGAEMDRLGDKAEAYGLATEEGVKSATRFQEAIGDLGKAFIGLGNALANSGFLDTLTAMIGTVTGWVKALGDVNPKLLTFTAVLAGIGVVAGPVVVALGVIVAALGAVSAPVLAVGAVIAIVVAGLVAFWPGVVAAKDAVVAFGKDGLALLAPKFQELQNWLIGLGPRFQAWGKDMETGLGDGLKAGWAGLVAWFLETTAAITGFFAGLPDQLARIGRNMFDFFLSALKAGWALAAAWFPETTAAITGFFAGLPDQLAQIGRNMLGGLWNGISERWEALKGKISAIPKTIAGYFTDAWQVRSPSQLFHDIGENAMQGLRNGLVSKTGSLEDEVKSFAQNLGDLFAGVLTGATDFADGLRSIVGQSLGNIGGGLISDGLSSIGQQLGIPGFASGTGYAPGGLARINELGGEIVNLPNGAQVIPHDLSKRMVDRAESSGGGGGGLSAMNINVSGARGNSEIMEMVRSGVTSGLREYDAGLPDRVNQIAGDTRFRG